MEKFSDYTYERPDFAAIAKEIKDYTAAFQAAKTYEEQKALYLKHAEETAKWRQLATIVRVRHTVNTKDEFYDAEQKVFNGEIPKLMLLAKEADAALLASPFRDRFAEEFGKLFIERRMAQQKLANEAIIPDEIEESNLQSEYVRISAGASVEFNGKVCNFYGLLKAMQSTDRKERKEAMAAWGDLYASIADQLDDVYDRLVAVRRRKAEKLGMSYIDYIYTSRGRYDYNAEDIEVFRRQIREIVVPLCVKLREQQAERLGVEKLYYYDEALMFAEGNPEPEGTTAELVEKALAMYRDMSPETAEYFTAMVERDHFDLETKPGKQGGGYCCFLPAMRMPFIFSNFNGTSADVDVLTHEAGHGFEAYYAARKLPLTEQIMSNTELAEVHSMTMEHFAYKYMESFFGDKAEDYRKAHLWDALLVIPYMCAVDEFQHRVFEDPSMDAAGRRQLWKKLEETYLPWRDYDGHPFLAEGGYWMQKQHIFMFPFYYIDYALAQTCAFQIYAKMVVDRTAAWEQYLNLCGIGGKLGYFETLDFVGLDNPLKEGTVKKVMEALRPQFGV